MILDGKNHENINKATELLLEGELVAFPTETVYGLGALASDEAALKKIFKLKGRPTTDPLILHLHSEDQLKDLVKEVPDIAKKLIPSFWPGPLTLVFKKSKKVSDLITANLETVAIRIPKNEIALQLLKQVGEAVAAPSANKFQSMSPTTAQAVAEELGESLCILDGGLCENGLESTVLSIGDQVKVLRLGAVPVEDIEMVLGYRVEVQSRAQSDEKSQVSPGLLSFHYAPRTRLIFCRTSDEAQNYLENSCVIAFDQFQAAAFESKDLFVLSQKGDLVEAAQNLFVTLRMADQRKRAIIVALAAPEHGLGRAINDRLRKAQHL